MKAVILCIDDEVSILKSLERCLVMSGFEVLTAKSGAEALLVLEARGGRADLIIVDQRMPGMTGDEFLKASRDRFGPITSIMLSGYADFSSLMRAITEGEIYRFIAKPWDNNELLSIIRSALRNRSDQDLPGGAAPSV